MISHLYFTRTPERLLATALGVAALCGAAFGQTAPAGPTLTGDTSRPSSSMFAAGEPVTLTFQVSGLAANDSSQHLLLNITDAHDVSVWTKDVPIAADASGNWTGNVDAPHAQLGFYRVHASLTDGVTLPAVFTRKAGYLTYAVVPDPAQRKLYPEMDTHFGMQGGFSDSVNVIPYLGVRWVLSGHGWSSLEPKQPGTYPADLAAARAAGGTLPAKSPATEGVLYNGKPWKTYALFSINGAPDYAIQPDTKGSSTAALKPEYEDAYKKYIGEAAREIVQDYPDYAQRIYQITWEPVFPWGFKGTDEQLIKYYQLAYPAIHAVDPKALVVGPTDGGLGQHALD